MAESILQKRKLVDNAPEDFPNEDLLNQDATLQVVKTFVIAINNPYEPNFL
jgi:hypothetical protein